MFDSLLWELHCSWSSQMWLYEWLWLRKIMYFFGVYRHLRKRWSVKLKRNMTPAVSQQEDGVCASALFSGCSSDASDAPTVRQSWNWTENSMRMLFFVCNWWPYDGVMTLFIQCMLAPGFPPLSKRKMDGWVIVWIFILMCLERLLPGNGPGVVVNSLNWWSSSGNLLLF